MKSEFSKNILKQRILEMINIFLNYGRKILEILGGNIILGKLDPI